MNDSSEAVPNETEKKKKHKSPGTPKRVFGVLFLAALILCAAGWLLYIGAMILPSSAMRAFWTAVPFALVGVPLALLTGTAAEIFPRKERFEHRYADRIESRWPAASVFTVILAFSLGVTGTTTRSCRASTMVSRSFKVIMWFVLLLWSVGVIQSTPGPAARSAAGPALSRSRSCGSRTC